MAIGKLKETTAEFLKINGFKALNAVQEATLEEVLKGRDVVTIAPTGSGKTHAFLIPLLEMLEPNEEKTQAIISVPTRELALQIEVETRKMLQIFPNLRVRLLCGGMDNARLIDALKNPPQIIIATPGKLKDLYGAAAFRVDTVKMFIIDEADMTLEYGFLADIDEVFAKMIHNPQVLCFSATLAAGLRPFFKKYLANPQIIQIADLNFDPQIEHILINAKHKSYGEALLELLPLLNPYVCLIFANTREECQKTAALLKANDYKVLELHGALPARERLRAIKQLQAKTYTYVVATDVASRGLDIDGITHVISLGFPQDLSFYIHRSGRTGRSGREGTCYTIYRAEDRQAITSLTQKGIKFTYRTIKNGKLVALYKRQTKHLSYADHRAKELARILRRKKEKVKPNYKKKKNLLIAKITQQERQQYIRKKIAEEKKERYRAQAIKK